jgi:hypothetical protein
MSKVLIMRTYLGLPIWFWDTRVEDLLEKRNTTNDLLESDEDTYLPYFATRTLAAGVREGTLADLALLIAFGDDIIGLHLDRYAKKAFALATGLVIDWDADETVDMLTELRRIVD